MGAREVTVFRFVINAERSPPGPDEPELTLIGPGYGESIVLHVGDGAWVLVDSCIDSDGTPRALAYLRDIGVDPARSVCMVVASHWHDDHIRGMAQTVRSCENASFCCAAALRSEEFLSAVEALERRHLTVAGSGVRELHRVFSGIVEKKKSPQFATANCRLFRRGACEIWSLSPSNSAIQTFWRSVGARLPGEGETKTRVPDLSPNEAAVVLWVRVADVAMLLGSDLEAEGWGEILRSEARPDERASVFKVPHHGSQGAHEPGVWERMLTPDPVAVLTPWSRGGRVLPRASDVQRLTSCAPQVYATAPADSLARKPKRGRKHVDRALQGSGITLRKLAIPSGAIRLRRKAGSAGAWKVDLIGEAHRLSRPDSQ